MIDLDRPALKELERIYADVREAQARIMRLVETMTPHCKESLLNIEKILSNVRFEIQVAVHEIEGEV